MHAHPLCTGNETAKEIRSVAAMRSISFVQSPSGAETVGATTERSPGARRTLRAQAAMWQR